MLHGAFNFKVRQILLITFLLQLTSPAIRKIPPPKVIVPAIEKNWFSRFSRQILLFFLGWRTEQRGCVWGRGGSTFLNIVLLKHFLRHRCYYFFQNFSIFMEITNFFPFWFPANAYVGCAPPVRSQKKNWHSTLAMYRNIASNKE